MSCATELVAKARSPPLRRAREHPGSPKHKTLPVPPRPSMTLRPTFRRRDRTPRVDPPAAAEPRALPPSPAVRPGRSQPAPPPPRRRAPRSSCSCTACVVNRPALSPLSRSNSASTSPCPSTLSFTAARSTGSAICFAKNRSMSRSLNVAFVLVSTPARPPGPGRPPRLPAPPLPFARSPRQPVPHPDRSDMCLRHRARRLDANLESDLRKVPVLQVAPDLPHASPSLTTARPPTRRTSGSRSRAFFAANPSPSTRRVEIRRCACQFATSDSVSPTCGA